MLLVSSVANGYPEGAPWGAANPGADESCAACHYDYEPVADSEALRLEGIPDAVAGGEDYEFILRFTDATAAVSGFQVVAAGEGVGAGRFVSNAADMETSADAVRSTATQRRSAEDGFRWRFAWHAPEVQGTATVVFYLAASSANDDQSPFGDRIHYRTVPVTVLNKKSETP